MFEGKAELLNEPTVNTTMAADYSQPIRITPTRFIRVE